MPPGHLKIRGVRAGQLKRESLMKLLPQQPGVREIKVKLMLSGGHAAMLVLPPEHPLLAQLFQTIAAPGDSEAAPPATLFQIPIEGGRASLTFASHQLVGVVTDPAVLVQPETETAPAAPKIIRHPFVQLDEFLSIEELKWLVKRSSAHRAGSCRRGRAMTASRTTGNRRSCRRRRRSSASSSARFAR